MLLPYCSPIKVVAGDVAGVVTDGPDMQMDIDNQLDVSEVTMTFSGFESQRDGLARYEWAIGLSPRFDDVMPYSYIDLMTVDTPTPGMLGNTIVQPGRQSEHNSQLLFTTSFRCHV